MPREQQGDEPMPDNELLALAIMSSGLASRRFAAEVLGIDERNVRRALTGEYQLHPTARIVCKAIVARPKLARELARAAAAA